MTMVIDDATWPLVALRWTGRATDAELSAFLAQLDGWLAGDTRFALLIDARGALGFTGDQRRRVIAHMKAARARTERLLVQAVVHDNAIQRTLSLLIEVVVPPPFPSKSFADPDLARTWLLERIAGDAR